MKVNSNNDFGKLAEQKVYLQLLLLSKKYNFDFQFINSYYDVHISKKGFKNIKLEIKSCCFFVRDISNYHRYGRFDFTKIENLIKQKKEKIDILFLVHINKNYEILGVLNSKNLSLKRYFNLNYIMNKKLTSLEEFIKRKFYK